MRDRLSRLSRIVQLQKTLGKNHEARLSALRRKHAWLNGRIEGLLELLSSPSPFVGLAQHARRQLASLTTEIRTLETDILAAQHRLVAARRKGGAATRLSATLERTIREMEERSRLEEISLASETKASRKAADR